MPEPSLAANASRRLKTEDLLITQYAGTLLRRELDRIPLWKENHILVKELADYFARYVYLPRLKNDTVLLEAIREGVQSLLWERETFAYADSWDTERNQYLGLKAGQQVHITMNANSLIVKPEAAAAQIAAASAPVTPAPQEVQPAPSSTSTHYAQEQDHALSALGEREGSTATTLPEPLPTVFSPTPLVPQSKGPKYHRFYGSVTINERKMGTEAGNIMEEVVKHLTSLYSVKVKVTLEVQAELPNGASEETVRTVLENCRTLKFEQFGFEEE